MTLNTMSSIFWKCTLRQSVEVRERSSCVQLPLSHRPSGKSFTPGPSTGGPRKRLRGKTRVEVAAHVEPQKEVFVGMWQGCDEKIFHRHREKYHCFFKKLKTWIARTCAEGDPSSEREEDKLMCRARIDSRGLTATENSQFHADDVRVLAPGVIMGSVSIRSFCGTGVGAFLTAA